MKEDDESDAITPLVSKVRGGGFAFGDHQGIGMRLDAHESSLRRKKITRGNRQRLAKTMDCPLFRLIMTRDGIQIHKLKLVLIHFQTLRFSFIVCLLPLSNCLLPLFLFFPSVSCVANAEYIPLRRTVLVPLGDQNKRPNVCINNPTWGERTPFLTFLVSAYNEMKSGSASQRKETVKGRNFACN